MGLTVRTSDESTIRLLDGLVVLWTVLWVLIGAWFGYTTWQLSEMGDTVTSSGRAIQSAGEALESLGGVPVVGDTPAELGEEVVATGDDVAGRGQEFESNMRQLALLLGIAIALMPITPVAGLYLPLRSARRRDVRQIRRALEEHGHEASFDRYLAERALQAMPYETVRSLVGEPWEAVRDERVRILADAELARLGVQPSPR